MSAQWCEKLNDSAQLDPYLHWAAATQWRSLKQHTGPDQLKHLRFIARASATDRAWLEEQGWEISQLYNGSQLQDCLHFTGKFPLERLNKYLKPRVPVEWELSVPFRDAELRSLAQPIGLEGPTRDPDVFRITATLKAKALDKPKGKARKPQGVIAVIDFGCPFLHRQFEGQDGGTRIAALWDQGAEPKENVPFWRAASWGCEGRELHKEDIDGLLGRVRSGDPEWDESRVYKKLDHLIDYDDARRRVWGHTHGAHVLDIAGGRVDPLTGEEDDASHAELLFVQLPALTASDASGASLGAQLLDAVRWCMKWVDERHGPEFPLVVNISYGGQAGPHNGTAMLERALDELLEQRKTNFAVVLGAGNAGSTHCHAHRVVRTNRSGLFGILVADDDATDTFIECWYDPGAVPAAAKLKARARAPGSAWSDWVEAHQVMAMEDTTGQRLAILCHTIDPPNGRGGMLLLALSPTRPRPDSKDAKVPAGRWELEWMLEWPELDPTKQLVDPFETLKKKAEVRIDCWVERDDAGAYSSGAETWLEGTDVDDALDCMSNIAEGKHTIAVGGYCRSTGDTVPYSSQSPRKNTLNQLYVRAACEDTVDLRGFVAAAVRSAESHRMNGTSVAAPVLARRLFNRMVKEPVARERMAAALHEIVEAEAKSPTGPAVRE